MAQTGASSRTPAEPPPTVGLEQRDRHWRRTRIFLAEHGLSALVLAGFRGRESFETYLSGESIQGAVVFPAEGEPVYLTWSAFRKIGRSDPDDEREYWIEDLRPGLIGPGILGALREFGLERARVGVVGLSSRNPMELEGCIPYGVWAPVAEGLPDAEFVEVSGAYSLLIMEKDEAELRLARHAAAVGERACSVMLETTRAGASESEIYAAVTSSIYGAGLALTPPSLIVRSGVGRLAWGPPDWGVAPIQPRRVAPGDLVYAELMPSYGGIETQQQMTIAVGKPDPLVRELAAVARASYDAGLRVLRPGLRFSELFEAMAQPLRDADCWHLSTLVHSVSPATLLGVSHGGVEKVFGAEYPWLRSRPISMDAELREGMLFSFEPNACRGRTRVNIGGTVAVTAGGAEELNSICCRLNEI